MPKLPKLLETLSLNNTRHAVVGGVAEVGQQCGNGATWRVEESQEKARRTDGVLPKVDAGC